MGDKMIVQRGQGSPPAITTTFVPPAQCTQGHLTMLARQSFYVWLNEPLPVAAMTNSACYPQEFMTSYLDTFRGTTLPAFSPLVCPQNYQTISKQDLGADSPYIVCCPNNYGFAPPAAPNPDRPGYGGTCYSNIISTTVTKYNDDAYSGLIFFSTAGQAYAHPFDGFAYQGHVATTAAISVLARPTPTSIAQSIPIPSAASPTPSPQLPSPQFSSEIVVSTVLSTIIPLTTVSSSIVVYSTISPSIITLYQSIPNNPNTSTTAAIVASATAPGPSAQVLTGGQIAGVVIGVIVGISLLISALLFFAKRRRRQAPTNTQNDPAQLEDTTVSYFGTKPKMHDHPSNLGFPNEKHIYSSRGSPNEFPSSPAPDYHELLSPTEVTQRHELGIVSARNSASGSPVRSGTLPTPVISRMDAL